MGSPLDERTSSAATAPGLALLPGRPPPVYKRMSSISAAPCRPLRPSQCPPAPPAHTSSFQYIQVLIDLKTCANQV